MAKRKSQTRRRNKKAGTSSDHPTGVSASTEESEENLQMARDSYREIFGRSPSSTMDIYALQKATKQELDRQHEAAAREAAEEELAREEEKMMSKPNSGEDNVKSLYDSFREIFGSDPEKLTQKQVEAALTRYNELTNPNVSDEAKATQKKILDPEEAKRRVMQDIQMTSVLKVDEQKRLEEQKRSETEYLEKQKQTSKKDLRLAREAEAREAAAREAAEEELQRKAAEEELARKAAARKNMEIKKKEREAMAAEKEIKILHTLNEGGIKINMGEFKKFLLNNNTDIVRFNALGNRREGGVVAYYRELHKKSSPSSRSFTSFGSSGSFGSLFSKRSAGGRRKTKRRQHKGGKKSKRSKKRQRKGGKKSNKRSKRRY